MGRVGGAGMSAIATRRPLPEVLAEMGVLAIDAMRPDNENCPDCRREAPEMCGAHQADSDLVDEFEDALEQIRAGEIVAALTGAARGGN